MAQRGKRQWRFVQRLFWHTVIERIISAWRPVQQLADKTLVSYCAPLTRKSVTTDVTHVMDFHCQTERLVHALHPVHHHARRTACHFAQHLAGVFQAAIAARAQAIIISME